MSDPCAHAARTFHPIRAAVRLDALPSEENGRAAYTIVSEKKKKMRGTE
jgi:hypothetical protein